MSQIPGTGILGSGFNILGEYGPSSATSRIFRLGKLDAKKYTYQPTGIVYEVPENASVVSNTTSGGSAYTFSDRTQLQGHFSEKAGAKFTAGGFSGEVNAGYSQASENDQSFYYGLYEAYYNGWDMHLDHQSSDWVSTDFTDDPDVKNLPDSFTPQNQDAFFAVFRKFGTHFVSQVTVGGSFYYFVAVDKSFSSNEETITVDIKLEYNAVFASGSAESKTEWGQLSKHWAESRSVNVQATGGDTSALDGLAPGFDSNDKAAFDGWKDSVMKNPAAIKFTLRPLDVLFSGKKADAVREALDRYMNGAIYATAGSDYTPRRGPGGSNFTTSSMIIVAGQVIAPNPPAPQPPPVKWGEQVLPISGYQVALLSRSGQDVILSRKYYSERPHLADESKIYTKIMADIDQVRESGYICVVCGFGIDLMNYPSMPFSQWLISCGAAMDGWKSRMGFTGSPGQASYVCLGRQGLSYGTALESFSSAYNWYDDPSNSTVDASALGLLYARSSLSATGYAKAFGSFENMDAGVRS